MKPLLATSLVFEGKRGQSFRKKWKRAGVRPSPHNPSRVTSRGRWYPNERPNVTTRGVLVGKSYTNPSDRTDFVLRGKPQTNAGLPALSRRGEETGVTRFGGTSPLMKPKAGVLIKRPEEEEIKDAEYEVEENPRLKAPEGDGKPEGPKPEVGPKPQQKSNSTSFALRTPAAFFGKKTHVGGTMGPPARNPTSVKRTLRNMEAAKLRWARSRSRPLAQALKLGAFKLPK